MQTSGGVFGILHGYSAEFQMKTPWFYLMCCFATIQMLRLNYFVATINTQYTYLFHSISRAELLNRFFDVALPLGGVLSIPFVGMFLDHMSTVVVLASWDSLAHTLLECSMSVFLSFTGHFSTLPCQISAPRSLGSIPSVLSTELSYVLQECSIISNRFWIK